MSFNYYSNYKNFEQNGNNCMMPDNHPHISDKSLAMAYVPWQKWTDLYEPDKALCVGTIFCQLNKPFEGGCKNESNR